MKQLFIKLSVFLPIFIVVGLVNYYVDAGNIFNGGKLEQNIAQWMIDGKNVAGACQHDDRQAQRLYINSFTERPDVVVFGSSRSWIIGREHLGSDVKIFNGGMMGSTIEDYLALYQLLHERGATPKKLIIGADPWIFNPNNGQDRWTTLDMEYRRGLARIKGDPSAITGASVVNKLGLRKQMEILNPNYFQFCMSRIGMKLQGIKEDAGKATEKCEPTTDENDTRFIRLRRDGSRRYSKAENEKTVEQMEKEAVKFGNQKPVYSLGQYTRIDPDYKKDFELFIKTLKRDGVEIVFYLPPYHPTMYSLMMKDGKYEIVEEVEKYLRALAKKNGIEVLGSYNPAPFDFTGDEFVDPMHLQKEGVIKVFEISKKMNGKK